MTDSPATRRPRSTSRSLFQRLPLLMYRGPMANVLHRRYVLLLTTVGRRSGQPRTVPLTYMPLGE
ncbi:MAG: nitroreductase family deazaflavin-dependent oxidoreductase, partial [Chloroflexi bacterium]|nr:nitroreductase family deazaflavin-dependent oxidoreductase [Chloroflexota bacterium]